MIQWLWKQKYRLDKGYQAVALVNLALLLLQSDRLARWTGLGITGLALIGVPAVLVGVWAIGYAMTSRVSQHGEDRAIAEVSPIRRDIDRILEILERTEKCKL